MKTWILVANASTAKLFATDNLRVGSLELIREFSHPDSRKKVADLISDKQGSYQSDPEAHGSYSSKSDPKEMEAERFAVELMDQLKAGLDRKDFANLLIVAADHFTGLLKKNFSLGNDLEVNYILKDYTKVEPLELHARLKEQLFF